MSKRNIVHIEIPVQNGQADAKFYESLFGWKITHDEAMDYTMFEPAQGPGGGFTQIGEEIKPGDILLYIDSPDIDADLRRIEEQGGSIVSPKTEIPTVGWFGIFKDPAGNTLALYTDMNPT
jgi:predicted enzyme related to lactoylglutathione lyase